MYHFFTKTRRPWLFVAGCVRYRRLCQSALQEWRHVFGWCEFVYLCVRFRILWADLHDGYKRLYCPAIIPNFSSIAARLCVVWLGLCQILTTVPVGLA